MASENPKSQSKPKPSPSPPIPHLRRNQGLQKAQHGIEVLGKRWSKEDPAKEIQTHLESVLSAIYLGDYWKDDGNLRGTPERVAKALLEMTEAIREEMPKSFSKTFPCSSSDMVVIKNLEFAGMCPHHLMPVEYSCDIGYIPLELALGLSKFHRISSWVAKEPLLQEELGQEIAKTIQNIVYPGPTIKYSDPQATGIIVRLVGDHSCMRVRGTKSPNSKVSTTSILGEAFSKPDLKEEFYQSLNRS